MIPITIPTTIPVMVSGSGGGGLELESGGGEGVVSGSGDAVEEIDINESLVRLMTKSRKKIDIYYVNIIIIYIEK